MDLYRALSHPTKHIRLTCEDRWMVGENGEFEIYERKHGQKITRVLKRTPNETEALRILKGG